MSGERLAKAGRLSLLALLLTAGACTVDTGTIEGKACDATHPCPAPLVCGSVGTCQAPTDGQTPGGPDGGNGSCVTWSQGTHGFASQQACAAGCSLVVDATAGNTVRAEVPGTAEGSDFAYAQVDEARLPTSEEGRLRGTFAFSDASEVREYLPFVVLRTRSGQTLLELGLDGRRTLQLHTDPGVLQAGTPTPATTSQEFRPGSEFTVEMTWAKNGARTLRVNDNEVLRSEASGGATQSAVPGALLLGIIRNDGTDESPVSLTLRNFVLCNSATGALP